MGDTPQVEIKHIGDVTPDEHNANRGTERGEYMIDLSFRKHGAGRSILLDKHGRIVGGNKSHAKAGEIGIDEVIIIHSDGKRLVAVQRDDVDLDTPEGRELALLDNRTGEVGLEWNPGELAAIMEQGVDLGDMWRPEELSAILEGAADELLASSVIGGQVDPSERAGHSPWERVKGAEGVPFRLGDIEGGVSRETANALADRIKAAASASGQPLKDSIDDALRELLA